MPQVQVVDTTENKPEPTGVEELFSKLGKSYKDKQDRVEIGGLIESYKNNRQDANAWENLQLNLEKSDISPTKRLETQKSLNEMKKNIIEKDKVLNATAKLSADEAKVKAEELRRQKSAQALRAAGATEDQVALYESASVGGQTAVIKNILEDIDRNKTPSGLLGADVEDKDKGLTPKERVDRQEKRFSLQTPMVNKNSEALHALEGEERSITLLQELDNSGKVGQGLHNLNINPKEGNLIIPKAGTAEEQLFVKTVNDFTVKAKDSFGAQVTNFELDRFMQRLPTLANSQEGRQLIMKQMKLINQINQLEKSALQKVFDKYGVRNIDYPDAENMARAEISEQKEELRKQYVTLEDVAKKDELEFINNVKAKTKEGFTAMRKPDGTVKQFPDKNVPNLEEKGYKKL
jgi:hypothetical protein